MEQSQYTKPGLYSKLLSCATKDEERLYLYTDYFCKDTQEVNDHGCLRGGEGRLWNWGSGLPETPFIVCSWRNTNLQKENKTLHVMEALLHLAPTYLWLLLCWGRSHRTICHCLTCSCSLSVPHMHTAGSPHLYTEDNKSDLECFWELKWEQTQALLIVSGK